MDFRDFVRRATAEPDRFFHGTTLPGLKHVHPAEVHRRGVTFPHDTDRAHAYASSNEDDAWHYAEKAWSATGHGIPRVYEVRPAGEYEKDPQFDQHGSSRSNFEGDHRSRAGWHVVRELPMPSHMGDPEDWQ